MMLRSGHAMRHNDTRRRARLSSTYMASHRLFLLRFCGNKKCVMSPGSVVVPYRPYIVLHEFGGKESCICFIDTKLCFTEAVSGTTATARSKNLQFSHSSHAPTSTCVEQARGAKNLFLRSSNLPCTVSGMVCSTVTAALVKVCISARTSIPSSFLSCSAARSGGKTIPMRHTRCPM